MIGERQLPLSFEELAFVKINALRDGKILQIAALIRQEGKSISIQRTT